MLGLPVDRDAGPGGLASNIGIALAGQPGQPGTDYTAFLE